MLKKSTRWIAGISIAVLAVACRHGATGNAATQPIVAAAAPAVASTSPVAASVSPSTIHHIDLPHYAPMNLPPGPGREAFASSCVGCHSSRYITTQPPLTAAKWEESVRKMMKTYNAPIAEDQVAPIVQYLMAAKEGGEKGQSWEAIAPEPAKATMVFAKLNPANADDELRRGLPLYQRSCLPCHGEHGHGDGFAIAPLMPKPMNFSLAKFDDRLIASTIVNGVRGTGMPAFPNFSNEDVNALVRVTQTFAASTDQPIPPASATSQVATTATATNPTATSQAAAAQVATAPTTQPLDGPTIFAQNCASCHGPTGGGDGQAAAALARRAANFHLKQPVSAYAFAAISNGVAGTAMPAWRSKLSDPQRRAVAEFVRSFYATRD